MFFSSNSEPVHFKSICEPSKLGLSVTLFRNTDKWRVKLQLTGSRSLLAGGGLLVFHFCLFSTLSLCVSLSLSLSLSVGFISPQRKRGTADVFFAFRIHGVNGTSAPVKRTEQLRTPAPTSLAVPSRTEQRPSRRVQDGSRNQFISMRQHTREKNGLPLWVKKPIRRDVPERGQQHKVFA
ncbi:hypothetical protein VTK73DRAFT_2633 [Phialemonium thermophilum]|uniref:Transmembrane protein n=1 Tax=Phialemonium thermophilum TaxID=223376 RepID=A0ABR3VR98_9PEZI